MFVSHSTRHTNSDAQHCQKNLTVTAGDLTSIWANIYHVDEALYASNSFPEGSLIHMKPPISTRLMLAWFQDVDAIHGRQ